MTKIVPVILTKTFQEFKEKLTRVQGLVDRVQVDIIDGQFTNNQTIGVEEIINPNNVQLDIHLMVNEPIYWVEKCRKIGTSLVVGQIEKMSSQKKFLEIVKMGNMQAGLGLDLNTNLEEIDKEVIPQIDHILLMSVKAGFSGQEFDDQVLEKIKRARKLVGKSIEVGVDGGINEANIKKVVKAGANVLYLSSALWRADNMKRKLSELYSLCSPNSSFH